MSGRLGAFILGIFAAIVLLFVGGYFFITNGGAPMETTARPLPLEATVAGLAIRPACAARRMSKIRSPSMTTI